MKLRLSPQAVILRWLNAERGDTLVEVTIALAILSMAMTTAFATATKATNLGQTAKERTQLAALAQEQAEALKSFRDSRPWSAFADNIMAGGSEDYDGISRVMNANCRGVAGGEQCFHMELKKVGGSGGVDQWVPAGGSITYDGGQYPNGRDLSTVAGGYNYVAITLQGITPTQIAGKPDVTFLIHYGLKSRGSNSADEFDSTNTVFVRLANLDTVQVATTPTTTGPPAPPPSDQACTSRGANLLGNSGTFPQPFGTRPEIDETSYGFKSVLPYRGQNVFPDDEGNNGTGSQQKWAGGLTQVTIPPTGRLLNPYFSTYNIYIRPFNGDTSVSPAVLPASTALFSNPNQTLTDNGGSYYDRGSLTYTGPLWQRTVTGLTPGKTYDFSIYVANVFTPDYFAREGDALVPQVGLRAMLGAGMPVVNPTEKYVFKGSAWQRLSMIFQADSTGTATFYVDDNSGQAQGDDFAMTANGIYECLGTPIKTAPASAYQGF